MFEIIDKFHESSSSDSILWEIEYSRYEVRVYAYHQGWNEGRSHTFSKMEIELSKVPLVNMIGVLDDFKPFLKEDYAS